MKTQSPSASAVAGRSVEHATFTIERTFDAPPGRVFAAFADPAVKTRWFAGPAGWQASGYRLDFRVGGTEHLASHVPGGVDHVFDAIYQDIVPDRRIVYSYEMHLGERRVSVSLATLEMLAAGSGTQLVLTEQGAFLDGADLPTQREEGTRQLLDNLAAELRGAPARLRRVDKEREMVEKIAGSMKLTFPSDREIAVTRAFDAPRRLVFEAWSNCEHLARWWGPRGFELIGCEIDLRPGGSYRFIQRAPDGSIHPFHGVYREIAAPERVVFTQVYEPIPDQEALVTTTLTEHDGKTALSQTLSFSSKEARDGMVASGMEKGEAESFERLDELLGEMAAGMELQRD